MKQQTTKGHLLALMTIFIWGVTFISTKVLLKDFQPIEILFFRFIIGLLALTIICHRPLKVTNLKQDLTFAGAGLCGITLYFLLENIALTYTLASNVGVIVSIAPFFTAVMSKICNKNEERIKLHFIMGFLVAISGIVLISFQGSKLELNPMGDLLAVFAAFVWSLYAVLSKKISSYGYPLIMSTRRIFTYGVLFMIPALFIFDFQLDLYRFAVPKNLFNMLFLGMGASALCFVTWNFSVKVLGAIKTSVYIYLVPVITVICSVIILHEKITILSGIGIILTLIGLSISEGRIKSKKEESRGLNNE